MTHCEDETTPLSPRISDVSDESGLVHADDYLRSASSSSSGSGMWADGQEKQGLMGPRIRHAVGIALLLATVFLWTASNFLASVG